MEWQGEIVWITGASSGIGEAMAHAFAKRGAALILSGRNQAALNALAEGLEADCHILPFEATDWDRLGEVVETALDWQGHVSLLMNNAGISQRSLAVDTDPKVYREILDIDLMAPIHLTQLLLPALVARARAGNYAAVAGISSVAGRIGVPLRTAYCAAKHGLIGYLDALRAETEAAYGMKVHAILPGSIRTNVSVNALSGDGSKHGETDSAIANGMDPAECARRIVEGIEAGQREIMVAEGQELAFSQLRHKEPEQLFAVTAALGKQLAAGRD